ncbi:membrane protein [Amycolatopsis decaplanina DSM 44594]|uniref:Membrane protein n=2 Tax=Amycolatopsis decaplanina TaxID=208441 RepID=M2ZQJ1_9PSEU|nr:membrane protein [Amycolatopsis decaplanina DSM 44594]
MIGPVWLHLALIAFTAAAFGSAPALARPTLPFGVRVPARRSREAVILLARRRYNRGIGAAAIAACAVVLLGWLAFEAVLVGLVVVCSLLGGLAQRSIVAAKRKEGWYAGTRQAVATDTSLRSDPVRPQWILLAPAVLLAVATAVVGLFAGAASFSTIVAQVLVIGLVALMTVAISRARPEIDAAQPSASASRYREYLHGVLGLLLISAGCVNATLLVVSLQLWDVAETTVPVTIVAYLPIATAFIAWIGFSVRAGDAGHRLPPTGDEPETRHEQRDDDRHWYAAGMIYVNRDDPALLVHRRVGTYWTLNLGHPVAWLVLVAVAVAGVLTGFGVVALPTKGG